MPDKQILVTMSGQRTELLRGPALEDCGEVGSVGGFSGEKLDADKLPWGLGKRLGPTHRPSLGYSLWFFFYWPSDVSLHCNLPFAMSFLYSV